MSRLIDAGIEPDFKLNTIVAIESGKTFEMVRDSGLYYLSAQDGLAASAAKESLTARTLAHLR